MNQYRSYMKRLQFLSLVLRDLIAAGVPTTDDKFKYVSEQYAAVEAVSIGWASR